MSTTIIKGLYEYFKSCPLMADGKLNVDFLPESGIEYSIDTIPTEDVIKRYMRGAARCQYVFAIRTVCEYGQEVLQQLDNSGFFEGLAAWIRTQNASKNFPQLPEGCTVEGIEAMSTVYLMSTDMRNAKYQVQCRIIYKRKGV